MHAPPAPPLPELLVVLLLVVLLLVVPLLVVPLVVPAPPDSAGLAAGDAEDEVAARRGARREATSGEERAEGSGVHAPGS